MMLVSLALKVPPSVKKLKTVKHIIVKETKFTISMIKNANVHQMCHSGIMKHVSFVNQDTIGTIKPCNVANAKIINFSIKNRMNVFDALHNIQYLMEKRVLHVQPIPNSMMKQKNVKELTSLALKTTFSINRANCVSVLRMLRMMMEIGVYHASFRMYGINKARIVSVVEKTNSLINNLRNAFNAPRIVLSSIPKL